MLTALEAKKRVMDKIELQDSKNREENLSVILDKTEKILIHCSEMIEESILKLKMECHIEVNKFLSGTSYDKYILNDVWKALTQNGYVVKTWYGQGNIVDHIDIYWGQNN